MIGYKTHVFICVNSRDDGRECCSAKNSAQLRDSLKDWAKREHKEKIRINASGCLGYCERGIAAVIYPKTKWLLDLNLESLEAVKQEINDHCK